MEEHTELRGLTDGLSTQIGTLQESYRVLAAATSLNDLSARMAGILLRAFPSAKVGILLQRTLEGPWDTLWENREVPVHPLSHLPDGNLPGTGITGDAGTDIQVVQSLVDQSHVALMLHLGTYLITDSEALPISLRLHAHLFAMSYQALMARRTEKELIFSLNHRVLQLNSLIDTGIEVTKLDQDIPPHHLALQRAASLTNAAKGVVCVTTEGKGIEKYMFPAPVSEELPFRDNFRITTTFTFGKSEYTFELFEKESRNGVVPFDETDQLLLDALARQVHASLENRYLHAQALEKQKMEQDLAVAASIQQRILPTELPTMEGYDVAGINIPSKSVGGDYYDCVPLPDGRFALIVADVAGKGIPAALLVSSFHAFLTAYLENTVPILEMARSLNRVICRASTDDKFITGFLGILDPATGEIETLNAGHTPGLLLKPDGTVRELNTGGVPFGMLDIDFPFECERATIEPGERLLLYTDGVTEAANEQYELYDTNNPLREFFIRRKTERAADFIQELIADVKQFTGSAPQNDDITALYLLRK